MSISLVVGDNGVLNQAQNASVKTTVADETERIHLAVASVLADNFTSNAEINKDNIQTALNDSNATFTDLEYATLIKYNTGNYYYVDKTGFIMNLGNPSEGNLEETYTYYHPKIPTGYNYIGGTYTTGIVISDVANDPMGITGTGNQFVWVPVVADDVDETTKATHFAKWIGKKNDSDGSFNVSGSPSLSTVKYDDSENGGVPSAITNEKDGDDYTDAKSSIVEKGGFWIGRYEASKNGTAAQVKVGQDPWNTINYTDSKAAADNFLTTNADVVSGLISGTQWDSTLNWLIVTGRITKDEAEMDSGSWGNYNNQTFTFSYMNGTNVVTGTKKKDTSTRIRTGSADGSRNMKNNIWDLAGNVWEWTTEMSTKDSEPRVARGGSYKTSGLDYPVVFRYSYTVTSHGVNLRFPCCALCKVSHF